MASAGRSAIIEVGGAGAATRARAPTTVQRGHIAGSLDCCSGALELSLDLGVPEFLRVAQVGRVGSVPLVQCHPRGRRLRYVQALVPRAAVVPKRRGSVLLCQCQQAPILFVLPWSVRLVDLVLDIPNHLLVAQHRRRGALLRLERLPCCRTDRRVAVVPRLRSPAELLRRGAFLLQEHVPRLLVLPQARRWELRRRGGHHVPVQGRARRLLARKRRSTVERYIYSKYFPRFWEACLRYSSSCNYSLTCFLPSLLLTGQQAVLTGSVARAADRK